MSKVLITGLQLPFYLPPPRMVDQEHEVLRETAHILITMEQPPAYSRPAPPSLEKSLPHQSPFAIPVPADTASHHRSTNRHPHPHGPQLPIPDPTASSAVVSAYIHSTLICNAEAYDIDPEEISRLSRVWKHGTGQELREYDQATFRELYGIPLGTMLHKQVLSDRQNPKDIRKYDPRKD